MYMKHISAGKHTPLVRLQALVHQGTVGYRIHSHAQSVRKLIFRDQPAGQKQRVAGNFFLRAGYGPGILIHLCHRHRLHTLLSFDVHHGSLQLQRNSEIIQTLYYVSLQSAGIGHQLRHQLYLSALQRHAAGHD